MPYRVAQDGAVSVLLITTRETRRWVVPKGNPIKGLSLHEAAADEAFEEAGVSGIACPASIGNFHYWKRKRDGSARQANVQVYPLAVIEQAHEWPERDERETSWFALPQAANLVEEPELKQIIETFQVDWRRAPEA